MRFTAGRRPLSAQVKVWKLAGVPGFTAGRTLKLTRTPPPSPFSPVLHSVPLYFPPSFSLVMSFKPLLQCFPPPFGQAFFSFNFPRCVLQPFTSTFSLHVFPGCFSPHLASLFLTQYLHNSFASMMKFFRLCGLYRSLAWCV